MINLTEILFNEMENSNKKIHKKIFDLLNKDKFSITGINDKWFYIEITNSQSDTIPNYAYDFVNKWIKRKGFLLVSESEV